MINLNFLILYFSGTGNTMMVCEEFKRQMEKLNNEVILYKIDCYDTKDINEVINLINAADHVGFAYPVYGANLPPIFDSFLSKLENSINTDKDAFIITTVGIINAFGPFTIKRRLRKLGFKLKWHMVCKVFNNTKYKEINKNAMIKIRARIQSEMEYLINNILNNKSSLKGIGPWIIGGYIVRKIMNKPLHDHYRRFYVDTSLCTLCMKCYKECPASAINYQNGNFTFNSNCTTCFRCRNKCPTNAIKEKNKKMDVLQL